MDMLNKSLVPKFWKTHLKMTQKLRLSIEGYNFQNPMQLDQLIQMQMSNVRDVICFGAIKCVILENISTTTIIVHPLFGYKVK